MTESRPRTATFSELAGENLLEISAGRPRSVSSDLPILRVTDVLDGRIGPTPQNYVPGNYQQTAASKVSKPGDIVLTTKGTVGRVAIMPADGPEFAYSPQLCYFRPAVNGPLRPRYLYYWFKSAEFWTQANSLKSQTDMADFLSLSDVQSLSIRIPSLEQQAGIVDVLGALDDKIATSERIAITAQKLADVHFSRAVDQTDFGDETFGSVAAVAGGGTPSTKVEDYWNGSIAWTTPSDVTALASPYLFETERSITDLGLENCASQLYPAQSIFMTSRATIGAFALPQIPAAVNQGFIVVIPPNVDMRWWLFHEMRSRVDEMISLANGSTFLELSRKNFKTMQVRLPEAADVAAFARTVAPLHTAAAHSARESRTLAALRNTLLPQLMSGRLRVRDAEKIVEDAT